MNVIVSPIRIDTDGVRNALPEGVFGIDNYAFSGDRHRTYTGSPDEPIPLMYLKDARIEFLQAELGYTNLKTHLHCKKDRDMCILYINDQL